MKLEIRARELSASDRSRADIFRLLKVMDVPSTEPTTITFEADLYEGQTLLFRWMNADMAHDYSKFYEHMREWFEKDKRWLAAWQHTVFPNGDFSKIRTSVIRGRSGWEILSKALEDPNLDMSRATMDDPLTVKFLELANSNTGMFNLADVLCHYYFTNGPALELHQATIEGPLKMVDGPREMLAKKLQINSQVLGSQANPTKALLARSWKTFCHEHSAGRLINKLSIPMLESPKGIGKLETVSRMRCICSFETS